MSQRKRIQTVTTIIEDLKDEEEFDQGVPYEEIRSFASDLDIQNEKLDHALEKLCSEGKLYRLQEGDSTTYRLT